jgi:hypothetical protein
VGGSIEQRIKHHESCRSDKTLTLEKINPDWIWDYTDDKDQ